MSLPYEWYIVTARASILNRHLQHEELAIHWNPRASKALPRELEKQNTQRNITIAYRYYKDMVRIVPFPKQIIRALLQGDALTESGLEWKRQQFLVGLR